jgi:hypothetical protein
MGKLNSKPKGDGKTPVAPVGAKKGGGRKK